MNKLIKILLLVVAVIAAISGVLLYIKTVISPPQQLSFKNQYDLQLKKDIDDFRKGYQASLEYDFASLADRIQRFRAESAIDEKSFEDSYSEFIGVYSPKLAQYCFGKFAKSVWDDNDLTWMEGRIAQLRDLTVENGAEKIMDDYPDTDGQFTIILKVIKRYREAKALSNKTSYPGLEEARNRIDKASQYKQEDYLRNNAALVKALNNLPSRLEASHYAFLRYKVNDLARYYSYSEDDYEYMSDRVLDALDEYKGKAFSVYGKVRGIKDLEEDASRYYKAARTYYANQE